MSSGETMPSFIVFGGPLASGKTTLAGRLAEHRRSRAIMEVVAEHPLIDDFYKDPITYALETEMIFTIMHYHDIARALKEGLFEEEVVSDLFFDGVEAYTSYTLSGEQKGVPSTSQIPPGEDPRSHTSLLPGRQHRFPHGSSEGTRTRLRTIHDLRVP